MWWTETRDRHRSFGLLATVGSTNHTIPVAIARAAGITIDWDDFDRLSRAVPCWLASIRTAVPT